MWKVIAAGLTVAGIMFILQMPNGDRFGPYDGWEACQSANKSFGYAGTCKVYSPYTR